MSIVGLMTSCRSDIGIKIHRVGHGAPKVGIVIFLNGLNNGRLTVDSHLSKVIDLVL